MVHRSLNIKDHGAELTPRDIDVIRLLIDGKSVGEIANTIGVNYKTLPTTVPC
jgi:DNA-binding NarL/FixJ family response regulator